MINIKSILNLLKNSKSESAKKICIECLDKNIKNMNEQQEIEYANILCNVEIVAPKPTSSNEKESLISFGKNLQKFKIKKEVPEELIQKYMEVGRDITEKVIVDEEVISLGKSIKSGGSRALGGINKKNFPTPEQKKQLFDDAAKVLKAVKDLQKENEMKDIIEGKESE